MWLEQIYEVPGKRQRALSSKIEPDLVRTWPFILKEMSCYWKVLSRNVTALTFGSWVKR